MRHPIDIPSSGIEDRLRIDADYQAETGDRRQGGQLAKIQVHYWVLGPLLPENLGFFQRAEENPQQHR
jgi:hypothetical protein